MGRSVCMFVYNNCSNDARVLKEAASLYKSGFSVKIIAVKDNSVLPYEIRNGVEIIRVPKNPIHYRILQRTLFKKEAKLDLNKLRTDYTKKNNNNSNSVKQKVKKTDVTKKPSKIKTWLYKSLNKLLLVIHKPLCFHDFYKKSLELNKQEPSDIYHGHDLHTVPTAYKTAKLTNAKVVYDAHELYTEMSVLNPLEKRFYTLIERKYAPKVDHLITVNESIAKELVDRYKLKTKPSIIFNCPEVDNNIILTETDVLRSKLSLKDEDKIVLYQGGFSVNRGLFNLIKAAQYISDDAKVVYMGWGKIESELKATVKKLNLEHKVIFTPGVPQNELLNHSKSADVGVIPYQFVGLNNYYTSPNKLFEYLNAKVPIAGSNFPELKRVIDKYNVGYTFDPENPKSIAAAINKVIDDKDLNQKLKENTILAAKDFTWEKEEKKLISIYEKL